MTRRFVSSNSKASRIPRGLPPPHPKHGFAGSSSAITSFFTSHQGNARRLEAPGAALPLGQFRPQNLAQDTYATRNLSLFHTRKTEAQRIRLGTLHVEVPA